MPTRLFSKSEKNQKTIYKLMKSREFDFKKDYLMVCKWWKDWGWTPIKKEFLPRTAIIVSNKNKDICCAWLYKTDSNICLIEWIISDKFSNKNLRKGCIEFLFEELFKKAKEFGYKAVFSSVRNPFLIKKMKKLGYSNEDKNMINLIKIF